MTRKNLEEKLGYMSEAALQLAQVAQESGHPMLALIFRMAALEASGVKPDISSQISILPSEPTTH